MQIFNFSDIEIFNMNGLSKDKFEGSFSKNELTKELINRWIPYYSCDACGKGDYCKFTVSYSKTSPEKRDIKCGVAETALEKYIDRTIDSLVDSDKFKQQQYLDCAFMFFRFVYISEQLNGAFINQEKLDYYGSFSKYFFLDMLSIRDVLNSFAENSKAFPELIPRQSLLLVEGKTEIAFIQSISGYHIFSRPFYFTVKSYNGKTNRIPKKIQMLLDEFHNNAYNIYFQGDADGSGDGSGIDKFKHYIDNGIIKRENIFQFTYDFETSIPRECLHKILQQLGYLTDISLDDFLSLPNDSINTLLKTHYNLDLNQNSLKVKIAKILGNIINEIEFGYQPQGNPHSDSELYKFINFLGNINIG